MEEDQLVTDERKIATIFNTFCNRNTNDLNIQNW